MNPFFSPMKNGIRPRSRCLVTSSIIGGNRSARAVLLMAPTSEINRPNCGIASAKATANKEELHIHFCYIYTTGILEMCLTSQQN